MNDMNSSMPRRMPPLSALRAFEAAARNGSFKLAAAELAVTPTAISHQIRSLEDHIGIALFERRTRKVELTDAGAALYPVLRDGLDGFAAAVDRLTRRVTRAQVTISATIAFTACWLVPRVSRFQAVHPEIDLRLQASDEVVDMARANVDIAIRYGQGSYGGSADDVLFADTFAPVANPLLGVTIPEDFGKVPLIEFQWRRHHPANPTWDRWFTSAGLDQALCPPTLRFSDESHAIQSAIAGQGIALVSLALVADDLAAGRLVQPFDTVLPGHKHSLLFGRAPSSSTIAAAEWLRSEAQSLPSPVIA